LNIPPVRQSMPAAAVSSAAPRREAVSKPSFEEIANNLRIMKETIDKGLAKQIDVGFIEILSNDIEGAEASKKGELRTKLHTLANTIYIEKEKPVSSSHERTIVGRPSSLQTLANTYVPGAVKEGLKKLDAE